MHKPVMLEQVLRLLEPPPKGVVVDGTVGTGGHARALAERIGRSGTLIAIDRDESMLELAYQHLRDLPVTLHLIHGDYRHLPDILRELGITEVDAILIDMGVCSAQLDDPQRGLAFRYDAPLDMRLDRSQTETAATLLQRVSVGELARILREYGGERWANAIAKAIIRRREAGRMNTTGDLVAAVLEAIPRKYQDKRIHPATRTFQAIRIAVNRELDRLQESLEAICGCLRVGGRIVTLAYHSLEDRAVKHAFRNLSVRQPEHALVGGTRTPSSPRPQLQVLTPKPLEPEDEEICQNPRARSAKLRAAQRVA